MAQERPQLRQGQVSKPINQTRERASEQVDGLGLYAKDMGRNYSSSSFSVRLLKFFCDRFPRMILSPTAEAELRFNKRASDESSLSAFVVLFVEREKNQPPVKSCSQKGRRPRRLPSSVFSSFHLTGSFALP